MLSVTLFGCDTMLRHNPHRLIIIMVESGGRSEGGQTLDLVGGRARVREHACVYALEFLNIF